MNAATRTLRATERSHMDARFDGLMQRLATGPNVVVADEPAELDPMMRVFSQRQRVRNQRFAQFDFAYRLSMQKHPFIHQTHGRYYPKRRHKLSLHGGDAIFKLESRVLRITRYYSHTNNPYYSKVTDILAETGELWLAVGDAALDEIDKQIGARP